jgi:hypothetical protein
MRICIMCRFRFNNPHKSPINLSGVLPQRLVERLLEMKRRNWRAKNRDAIEAYNRRIEALLKGI